MPGQREVEPGKAVLAGLVGGLAGAWAMSVFSAGWGKLLPGSVGNPKRRTVNIAETRRQRSPAMHASQQEWDSTLTTATAVARKVLHWPISEAKRERGAVAVHYAAGAMFGAVYSVMREYVPEVGIGAGAPFGAAVFVLAQEIGSPQLGISKPVWDYSFAMHANSLGEHLAWGVAADAVSRVLRSLW